MKMHWKRLSYFLIGVILGPVFLGLSIFVLYLATHGSRGPLTLVLYPIAAFLCFIAIVAGSAFRAAFRDPPWWIITPEQTRQSEAFLISRQILKITERRLKHADEELKDAERISKVAEHLENLKGSEPHDPANDRDSHR